MAGPVRAWWAAPAASPAPPRRVWRDWALLGLVVAAAPVEAALRPEVPSRWAWAVVLIVLSPTLLLRRSRPFTMLAVAWASGTAIGFVVGGEPQLLTTAYFLVLAYAVFRWGSGRAIVGGTVLLAIGTAMSVPFGDATAADLIGGLAVVVATATIGIAFRLRASGRERELDRVRLVERERFARDLHDTVAHHVSAIAIQAQAGTVAAPADPDAATAALRRIDDEASRTLDELRTMVRGLRADEVDLAPAAGVDEVRALARPGGGPGDPEVSVRVDGEAARLSPAIGAAVFRIAQEAVTNARRHARGSTRVEVAVRITPEAVRLEVVDDGLGGASVAPGFGITGMQERAALLGGTCHAGPAEGGGWRVVASIPRKERR